MQVTVALDGPRKRDLILYAGDQQSFVVTVYLKDGDTVPIVPTSIKINTGDFTIAQSTSFTATVPNGRHYRITGQISGVTTTLAYGTLYSPEEFGRCECWLDYGVWMCGIRPGYQSQPYFAGDYALNQ